VTLRSGIVLHQVSFQPPFCCAQVRSGQPSW
jgi:hypothetical protein